MGFVDTDHISKLGDLYSFVIFMCKSVMRGWFSLFKSFCNEIDI